MERIQLLASLAEIFGGVAVVFGIIFGLVEFRRYKSDVQREAAVALARSFQTQEFVAAIRFVLELPEPICLSHYKSLPENKKDLVWLIFGSMETIGIRVSRGDLPIQLVDELYSPDEIAIMKATRDAIDLMKIPEGAMNPSKTAWTLMGAVRRLFHWRGTAQAVLHQRPLYGGLLHTIGRALPGEGPVLQSRAVRQAMTQIPKPPPAAPPSVAAAIAGSRLANPTQE